MPQHQTITEFTLKALKPPDTGTLTLWDGSLKNFGMRISHGGTKSFIILLGSGKRQVIGRYPIISLAQARSKAQQIFAERTLGRHAPSAASWQETTAQFLSHVEQKNRASTYKDYKRILSAYFPFGTTKLSEITKQDIAKKLDKLSSTPSQQNNAIVCAKILFRWAVNRGLIDYTPMQGFVPRRSQPRARTLLDEELQSLWQATAEPTTFHIICRLLLLTGQRRSEIAALQTSWIKDNTITLPQDITKNGRQHIFPISTAAASLLTGHSTPGGLFFARGKETPFNGWSKSKASLDKHSGVTDWTLHDLRRTFATIHARIGTPVHVTEKLLNHVSGTHGGIVGVYQRHTYFPEMQQAMEAYEAHLFRLFKHP